MDKNVTLPMKNKYANISKKTHVIKGNIVLIDTYIKHAQISIWVFVCWEMNVI